MSTVLLVGSYCVFAPVTTWAAPYDDIRSDGRLLELGLADWKLQEKALDHATGTIKLVDQRFNSDPKLTSYNGTTYTQLIIFYLSDGNSKITIEDTDTSGKWVSSKVFCANKDYAFSAHRQTENGPYILLRWGDDAKTRSDIRDRIDVQTWVVRVSYCPYPSWGEPFPTGLTKGHLTLASAQPRRGGPDGLLDLTFAAGSPLKGSPNLFSKSPTRVTVDPTSGWRIVGERAEYPDFVSTVAIEYGPGNLDQTHQYKVSVLDTFPKVKTAHNVANSDVVVHPRQVVSSQEFKLGSIGLPEITPRHHHKLVERSIISAFLILLVALVMLLVRRSAQESRQAAPA